MKITERFRGSPRVAPGEERGATRRTWEAMRNVDLDRLRRLAEGLALLFYALAFVALLGTLVGEPGIGLVFLLLGACAHVARLGIEDFVGAQG